MYRNDTVWLTRHRPLVRIGTQTGRVVAYDPAFDLCMVEWEPYGHPTTEKVGRFFDDKAEEIRQAAVDIEEGYSVPHVRLLNAMALVIIGLMFAALILAWMGGLGHA